MRNYKVTIIPTVSGGNIEVKVSANSVTQAIGIIKTLPYFKSFVQMPTITNEAEEPDNNLTKLSNLIKRTQRKDQAELGSMD